MGRKIATVVAVEASNAPYTSVGPCSAASSGPTPFSRKRMMFSSTTMAASSVMPTANARPAREITLSVRPAMSRTRNAASTDPGIAMATIRVARNLRRNHHSTPTASAMPRPRLLRSISTDRWM